jgi:cytochrome c peroxidase
MSQTTSRFFRIVRVAVGGGLILTWFIADLFLALAALPAHAPHGTVTVDDLTVPDVGPMPTQVPTPPTNLTYAQKVELGKQLYFETRLSKNNSVSCAF